MNRNKTNKSKQFRRRTFIERIDHRLESNLLKQLGFVFILSLLAFLFCWGLMAAFKSSANPFWQTIGYFFDTGNLDCIPNRLSGWRRALPLLVTTLGMTLLTGLLISTFTNVLENRVNLVKAGLVTYKKIRNHSVIIGCCELTECVLRGLLECDEDSKTILLTNHDIEDVRKSLYSLLNNEEYDGRIVLYAGDYRLDENLKRLNLPVAKKIYVLGDDEMQSRDYENLVTAQKISNICASSDKSQNNGEPTPLYVRMDRTPSFSTLQRLNINSDFFSDKVYFRPFNYYEHWTRMLWARQSASIYDLSGKKHLINYPSLFFDKSAECQEKHVHLVVSGFSEMGMSVTLQAIRLAHYGNFSEDKSLRTQITVVDPNMDNLKPSFLSQFRHLDQIYDIDIDFRNCRLEDIDKEITEWSCDKKQMLTLAICLGDADTALSQALSLPLEVYYQYGRSSEELPRILVRQKSLSGIWKMLKERPHEELIDKQDDTKAFRTGKYCKYHNLYPFGMLASGFYPDDMDDLKACLMHIDYEDTYSEKEENGKITIANLYSLIKNGDMDRLNKMAFEALKRWHSLQENTKWANRYQTDIHLRQKAILNAAGITEPEQLTEDKAEVISMCGDIEHRRWVAERVLSGWQQSPFVKDGKPMRQDKLLLHYDITPDVGNEKAKDELAVRNILMLDAIFDYYKTNRQ